MDMQQPAGYSDSAKIPSHFINGDDDNHQNHNDEDCCPSVFITTSDPQSNHLYHHHLHQTQQHLQHQMMFLQTPPAAAATSTLTHQSFHQPPPPPTHPTLVAHGSSFFDVNFKLGLNENSGNNDKHHHQSLATPHHSWRFQPDSSATKLHQPFWCNDVVSKQCDVEDKGPHNYKHFGGELEAICDLANSKIHNDNYHSTGTGNATGSGSAIIGVHHGDDNDNVVDHGSEESVGEQRLLLQAANEKKRQKKRKRVKMKEKLVMMVGFFEGLAKQVMNHQEGLHRKFLETVQRMDKEKAEREEAWRREEAAKRNREAIARAHDQAVASSREALIVSHLEKITGQSINLPPRKNLTHHLQQVTTTEPNKECCSSRWPKAEVEALIQARGGLESRFLESGVKGLLWEEVSSLMATMGYQRSAKRCKEKWENINKYFKKTKESGKQRSPQSKTCPYFDQLDQLYSRQINDSFIG